MLFHCSSPLIPLPFFLNLCECFKGAHEPLENLLFVYVRIHMLHEGLNVVLLILVELDFNVGKGRLVHFNLVQNLIDMLSFELVCFQSLND